MSSLPRPFEIPKRLSLAAQAAGTVRKAIHEGVWKDYVPSERRLCQMLQVSRPTLRTALHQLAKEGLIEISQGRRNRLLHQGAREQVQNHLVALVTHEPLSHMSQTAYESISEMRAHLAEQGFATEVLVCHARSPAAQCQKLATFVRQNRVFCCVLLSVSKELQHWAAESRVPALVLGSCHPEIELPSLDVDYRSVCRHAAGLLLGKGHRRIALVVPNSGVAGDLASERGFTEAVSQSPHPDARAFLVRHNGTARSITTKLDSLFNSASPPTALLVAKPQHVFIVIIYLLKRGLSVPDTVSLIARDQDHIFEKVSPPIAHYSYRGNGLVHRLSRLMLQMVNHGSLPVEHNLVLPELAAGGTVRVLV